MMSNVSPSGPVGISANVPSINKLGQLMSFQGLRRSKDLDTGQMDRLFGHGNGSLWKEAV